MRRLPWLAGLLPLVAAPAWAQMTPVGSWQSVDDKTGQAKAEIVIREEEGVLTGHIRALLRPDADPDAVCDRCSDDRKDQPIVGMEIIRGATRDADADHPVWTGGSILDPEKGSTYALKLTPVDGGRELQVRGSVGPFGRTQVWQRID